MLEVVWVRSCEALGFVGDRAIRREAEAEGFVVAPAVAGVERELRQQVELRDVQLRRGGRLFHAASGDARAWYLIARAVASASVSGAAICSWPSNMRCRVSEASFSRAAESSAGVVTAQPPRTVHSPANNAPLPHPDGIDRIVRARIYRFGAPLYVRQLTR